MKMIQKLSIKATHRATKEVVNLKLEEREGGLWLPYSDILKVPDIRSWQFTNVFGDKYAPVCEKPSGILLMRVLNGK
jgi:hypothetical protein